MEQSLHIIAATIRYQMEDLAEGQRVDVVVHLDERVGIIV